MVWANLKGRMKMEASSANDEAAVEKVEDEAPAEEAQAEEAPAEEEAPESDDDGA